jgi:hypothetical protein
MAAMDRITAEPARRVLDLELRLDTLQSAIYADAIDGDLSAQAMYLRIADQRAHSGCSSFSMSASRHDTRALQAYLGHRNIQPSCRRAGLRIAGGSERLAHSRPNISQRRTTEAQ